MIKQIVNIVFVPFVVAYFAVSPAIASNYGRTIDKQVCCGIELQSTLDNDLLDDAQDSEDNLADRNLRDLFSDDIADLVLQNDVLRDDVLIDDVPQDDMLKDEVLLRDQLKRVLI